MKRRNLGSVLENAILVTADLVGLYPSIPHEVGSKALRKVLDKREQHTIPTSKLIRMADFVLKSNYYEFGGQTKQLLITSLAHPTRVFLWIKLKLLFLKRKNSSLWCGLDILTIFFLPGHMVGKNFELFCVFSMSSILTSNLYMSQAKKAWHFLTCKLVLKAVRLLQICIENLLIAINISITCLLIKTTPNDL